MLAMIVLINLQADKVLNIVSIINIVRISGVDKEHRHSATYQSPHIYPFYGVSPRRRVPLIAPAMKIR